MPCSVKAPVLVVTLAVLAACEAQPGDESSDRTPPESGDTDSGAWETAEPDGECTSLTWDNFGRGELRNWCTGCHSSQVQGAERFGAPAGSDFDSHGGVLAHRLAILERATTAEPDMPPVGGGDAEDRARLRQWLECGAP